MSRSSTAPMVALTIALINPLPRWIPSWGSNQLPIKAPRIPMTTSPMIPSSTCAFGDLAVCPRGSITDWLAAVCIKLTSWLHHGALNFRE